MKNLLGMEGAQKLSKLEQQSIKGGEKSFTANGAFCCEWCPDGSCNSWVDDHNSPCPFVETCN